MARRILAILLVLGLLATNLAATLPLCRLGVGCLSAPSNCCCSAARKAAGRCCCAKRSPPEEKGFGFTAPKCCCRAVPALPQAPTRSAPVVEPPQWTGGPAAPAVIAADSPAPLGGTHAPGHGEEYTGPPLRVLLCIWLI